jgi:hypothetical protein
MTFKAVFLAAGRGVALDSDRGCSGRVKTAAVVVIGCRAVDFRGWCGLLIMIAVITSVAATATMVVFPSNVPKNVVVVPVPMPASAHFPSEASRVAGAATAACSVKTAVSRISETTTPASRR